MSFFIPPPNMNYLDAYDIRGDTDAPAQPGHQTLNEEVSQLASNLTGFWKGFVKQSSAALQTGLQEVAQQAKDARKELNWIATGSLEEGATASGSSATTEKEKEATSAPTSDPAAASSQEEDKENEKDPNAPSTDPPTSPTSASFNFLSKLQSSIPPSLVSTVQNALPDSVKQHAAHPGSVDFAALRTTLSSEFQRVAGVTRAQAEEYVHRSEGLIREAVKHGGDLLKDAVKVVPPDPNLPSGTANTGVVWDGTDVWAFDALPVIAPSSSSSSTSSGKGKEKVPALSSVQVQDAQKAVATRAEALLKRLRHDPEILKADPDADASLQDMYPTWIAREVVAKDGGINGVEWAARIEEALGDGTDGKALQATYNALVPAKMTRETFWTRYFFRVYQIQREEARRKALLEGATQQEEDIGWEDDEDDTSATPSGTSSTTIPKKPPPPIRIGTGEPGPGPHSASGKTRFDDDSDGEEDGTSERFQEIPKDETAKLKKVEEVKEADKEVGDKDKLAPAMDGSPRHSSESSYDVVSGASSVVGDGGPAKDKKAGEADEGEDSDSDWE